MEIHHPRALKIMEVSSVRPSSRWITQMELQPLIPLPVDDYSVTTVQISLQGLRKILEITMLSILS